MQKRIRGSPARRSTETMAKIRPEGVTNFARRMGAMDIGGEGRYTGLQGSFEIIDMGIGAGSGG